MRTLVASSAVSARKRANVELVQLNSLARLSRAESKDSQSSNIVVVVMPGCNEWRRTAEACRGSGCSTSASKRQDSVAWRVRNRRGSMHRFTIVYTDIKPGGEIAGPDDDEYNACKPRISCRHCVVLG